MFVGGSFPVIVTISQLDDVARKADAKPLQHVAASRAQPLRFFGFLASSRSDAEAASPALQNADVKLGGRSLTFDRGARLRQNESSSTTRTTREGTAGSVSRRLGCETHLVTGVGLARYTCLPKGGLVDAHADSADRARVRPGFLDDATPSMNWK